jgi:hypothetical protein
MALRDFSQSSRPSGDAATRCCLTRKTPGNANLAIGGHHDDIQAHRVPNVAEWAAKMPSKGTKVNLWESGEVP